MSFRQGYVPVPHGFCPAVNAGEIGALHPAHQFGPDLRVNDPVQIERVFGIIVKGGRHPHLGDLETGLVIEIIQLVVIVVEQIVGMPDILMRPVIQRGRAPHILEMLCDPADSFVAVLFIEKTAVALEGFVRPHTQKTDSFSASVGHPVPAAKLFGQILLVHPVTVGGHGIIFQIDHIFLVRHGTHPAFFLFVVPGIPVHLIIAHRCPGGHGKADPVRLHPVLNPLKSALDIFCGDSILCLKILVKYADWPVRIVFIPKIQQQIQQKPAVFPAGKRNVNIVKFPENKIKPLQKRVVNILLQILPYHWKTSPFCP